MSLRKRLLVFLSFLFLLLLECPQTFGQYRFDSWTTDNGLPQNGIRGITQTPDGYIWFTTFDGLVKFDGVKFTVFNKNNTKGIINNRFSGIYYDDGTLYANSAEGGTLTILRNETFNSYTSEQIPGHYIESIRPYKNKELGFLVVDGNNYERNWYFLRNEQFVLSESLKNSVLEHLGKDETRWLLSSDKVIESNKDFSTVYNHQMNMLQYLNAAFPDSKGGLWVGGSNLIYLKNGKIEEFSAQEYDFPKNKADFHHFWEDDDGSIWFANGGPTSKGLGLVKYKDGKFSSFGKEAGLSDSSIFSVFKDREGIIWLATNKGINKLRKQIIKTYTVSDGLNGSEVYPILRDSKNDIWIGTNYGLTVYRNGKFETVKSKTNDETINKHIKEKDNKLVVQSLYEDKLGKLWVGTTEALFVLEKDVLKVIDTGHNIYAIYQDKSGNTWAATNKGVLLFQDYEFKRSYSVADGLPNEWMTVIYEDSSGRLWFGGYGGLSEFKDGKFINYVTKEGSTGNHIRSIYEDKEKILWIGTYGEGLSRFKDGKFVNFTTKDGLFANDAFAIQEDKHENFWISSNKGIYRVKRQELNDFADNKIDKITSVSYGKEDGMLNNECNGGRQPASITDKDGNFWFPTQDGVVVVNPENEEPNKLPPSVVIESATVDRKDVDISGGLIIDPEKRNIEINFTGISSIKPEQIKFKYKLEGHDSDWIDAGTRRTAYYSHIPSGSYIFRVKAANSDGVWNEQGSSLKLELKPFFYQTQWFRLLCTAIFLILLYIIWKTSVYHLKRRERKLARLVDEKTEELKKANENLQHLANYDVLTKVANRRLFEEFLKSEWNRAIRSQSEISLILLDIDHFKLFNDTYGHQTGDECLKQVADALKNITQRPTDLLARFGGEEFVIILGNTSLDGAANVAKKAIETVKNLQILHNKSKTSKYVTISVGVVTTFATNEMPESSLIRSADRALYKAKKTGRNRMICNDLTLDFNDFSVLEEHTTLP